MILFLILTPFLFSGVQTTKVEYFNLRKGMVEEQIKKRGIIEKSILNSFLKVKRHLFAKPQMRNRAYDDIQLPYGEKDQYISKPYMIAVLTYAINPTKQKKILDIGTGSGYLAAILAQMVKTVDTIEIERNLSIKARKLVESLGYKNIKFKVDDGFKGWQEYAPFDGIIVTCSPDHIPPSLINQLAVGGRMVISIKYSEQVSEWVLVEKKKNGRLKKTLLLPVTNQFIP